METQMSDTTPVLELVNFRLVPGTSTDTFVALAQATEPALRRQPGYVSRKLVHTAEGQWTDIVEWQSLAQATEAARIVLSDPAFAPFIAAIDMDTVTMAHPALAWRMD
jgi:antibiotic biosynthesis monooxygenase (ABM) superfamily enzyme